MKLVRFLIYNFQMDGVCGLSPTLVLIWKGIPTPLVWWGEFELISLCLRNKYALVNYVGYYYCLCNGDLYGAH